MQDLIRHLPAVIFEYAVSSNGDQRFTYASEKCQEVLDLDAAALEASPAALFAIVHHDDLEMVRNAFGTHSVKKSAYRVAARLLMKEKSRRVEFIFNDEMTREGVILRRGLIAPIAEVQAHDDESRYEALLERLPVAVIIEHHGTVEFANTYAHNIVGAQPGHLVGLNVMDFVHPDYKGAIAERMRTALGGASVPMQEQKLIRIDGRVIDVETMAFPFIYKGRESIQVIFRDITEKKLIEAQVRKNETLFTQLFQNVPMAVVMLDESGKVSEVNKSFEEMFGYAKHELGSKNLNDYIVPEDLRSEGIDLNNLIASNRVVSIETIRKQRSGKLINVILCGVPVLMDNMAIGIYGVYIDITDRKRVEEELKVRNAELDNFVYKVSHDLRAPLSSVLGLVNLSRLPANTDDPHDYIRIIGEKIKALDNFIGDVLSHSKNLKMEVEVSRVDLQKIIDQTFKDLIYLDGAHDTKQAVGIEGIDFYSDHWRVSEIFRNLISNSIKYRKPGSQDSEIIIKVVVDHLCADISFSDNGIGIKEADVKRIFEMFFRATNQSEGSGIGLYIVKNAVEKLGGQIKVASSPGEGTRFHILLPNRINSIIDTSFISQEKNEDY